MKKSKIIFLLIVFMMMLFPVSTQASSSSSGTCGDKVKWTLKKGKLTISGSGNMSDGCHYEWMDDVKTVIIEKV